MPERTVMAIMGWSGSGMAARYQHVTDGIRQTVAKGGRGSHSGSGEEP
ncbi:hypothetical protein [Nonomuraea rosea]